jgi:hypothetical protein
MMSDGVPFCCGAMNKFIAELFKSPDGAQADEISVLAVGIGILFVLTLEIFLGLEIFDVVIRRHPFVPTDFSNAAAMLFGSAGTVLAAITVAMGIKARCGG